MTKLGKGLWDSPAFSTGNLEPASAEDDIGTVANPYHDGHFSGTVTSSGTAIADLVYTADPFPIIADTVDGADTKSAILGGGGAAAVGRGGFIQVFGNEAGGADNGDVNITAGNAAGSGVNITGAINATGVLTQSGNVLYTDTVALIAANTADAADTKEITISGGGAAATTRGAFLLLRGNEGAGNPGLAKLISGGNANSELQLQLGTTTSALEFMSSTSATMWQIVNSGDMTSNGTNGGSLIFAKATSGVQLQSGANGRTGTFTLNGASAVTISNTSLAAGDQIILSRDTIGGTPLTFNLTSRTNGTGFQVTGQATDTSGMRYSLVKIN